MIKIIVNFYDLKREERGYNRIKMIMKIEVLQVIKLKISSKFYRLNIIKLMNVAIKIDSCNSYLWFYQYLRFFMINCRQIEPKKYKTKY